MYFSFPPAPVILTCGALSSPWMPCYKELPPTRLPPPPLHLREAQPRGEVQKHTCMWCAGTRTELTSARAHTHTHWQMKLLTYDKKKKQRLLSLLYTSSASTNSPRSPTLTGFLPRLSAGRCQSQFCSDQHVWCALLHSAPGEIEEREMREFDGERCRGTCHTIDQRDIYDMHEAPLDKHVAGESVWATVGSVFLHVWWT